MAVASGGIHERIATSYRLLSSGHKQVAEYVLENTHRAAFMTLEQLASGSGVSRGTAERFARRLGFPGYAGFRRELALLVQESLAPVEKLRESLAHEVRPDAALRTVVAEDLRNIRDTLDSIVPAHFARALERIRKARRLVFVGRGASGHVAGLAALRLGTFRPQVSAMTDEGGRLMRELYWLGEEDAIVAIAFPRYSRSTVEACRYARGKGTAVIAITDAVSSPLYELADETLLARGDRGFLAVSLTAAVSVVDAIAVSVAGQDRRRALAAMTEITDQLIASGTYHSGEAHSDPQATRRTTRVSGRGRGE